MILHSYGQQIDECDVQINIFIKTILSCINSNRNKKGHKMINMNVSIVIALSSSFLNLLLCAHFDNIQSHLATPTPATLLEFISPVETLFSFENRFSSMFVKKTSMISNLVSKILGKT